MKGSIFSAFRDPVRRPVAIVWLGAAVCVCAALFVVVGVIGTSTRFFCAESCHHVQDDTIASYERSAHANISCIACHEPANGTPIQFMAAKLKSAGELPKAIARTFTFPLNKGSAYALNPKEMPDTQCTQCHSANRKITPRNGIKIDHAAHKKNGVTCTTCHNRVAHDEWGLKLTLAGNEKHADFTRMDACFRCHGLEGKPEAPGACLVCHTKDFNLVPWDHMPKDWVSSRHSEAARESLTEFGGARAEAKELAAEGISARLARPVEHCSTCHKRAFCTGCHEKLAKSLSVSAK